MTLPKWLYEALPWIYAAVGLAVMLLLRNWLATVSGGLLLATGFAVWAMRKRYRRETARHVVLGTLNLPHKLVWKPSLGVGHELLDRQHRQLFSHCNELITAVARHKSATEVQALLHELTAQLRSHAQAEERVAAEAGAGLPLAHQRQHATLLARIEHQRERWSRGQIDADELARFVAVDAVGEHVAAEAAQLAALGSRPAPRRRQAVPVR